MKLFLVTDHGLCSTKHKIVRARDLEHAKRIALRRKVDRSLASKSFKILPLDLDGRPGTVWSYSHVPDMD